MRFVSRLSEAETSGLRPLRYEVTRGPAYNERCVFGAISRVHPASTDCDVDVSKGSTKYRER